MSLREYARKRQFDRTPEPPPEDIARSSGRDIFVVQLHHASRRHYDFRLQVGSVLRSWAVPKGPSFDPSVKRLAVEVEDHPLSYASFEGDIPDGYGAGHVDVFDKGTWVCLGDPEAAIVKGHLQFELFGRRLRGRWHLVRGHKREKKPTWFLVKGKDAYAGDLEADDLLNARMVRSTQRAAGKSGGAREVAQKLAGSPATSPPRVKVRRGLSQVALDRPQRAVEEGSSGGPVVITHPDRAVYPDIGVTKKDVFDYYVAVMDWFLPGVVNRPTSVIRWPGGIEKPSFFQKHLPSGGLAHVGSVRLKEGRGAGAMYLFPRDANSVLELVQFNAVEFHPWGATVTTPDLADRVIFDFDPDPSVDWARVKAAARLTRTLLEKMGLQSFVRTTGGKGLHVVVPLDPPAPWAEVKQFAQGFAHALESLHPLEFVSVSSKARRVGRIYVDHLRNGRGATAVASYSLRGRPGAPVAMPISWAELGRVRSGAQFTIANAVARLKRQTRDPWEGIARVRQSLSAVLAKLHQGSFEGSAPPRRGGA